MVAEASLSVLYAEYAMFGRREYVCAFGLKLVHVPWDFLHEKQILH